MKRKGMPQAREVAGIDKGVNMVIGKGGVKEGRQRDVKGMLKVCPSLSNKDANCSTGAFQRAPT